MKKILILFITITLLSGCCVFTSQDCGCKPPSPDLSEEAGDWIVPFDDKEYLIFEDENGNKDSLKIDRVRDTEFIGGDECGTSSHVERAVLKSEQHPNLKFTIEATKVNYVAFNYSSDRAQFIYAEINAQNNGIDIFTENASGLINNNFVWNGVTISVLTINCEDSSNCADYRMRKFIVSKDLGLLNYMDENGTDWKRIN